MSLVDTRRRRVGERTYGAATRLAALLVIAVLVAVAAFLVARAWPALTTNPAQLAGRISWFPEDSSLLSFVGPLIFGTLVASVIALVISVPVAIGIALFVTNYAPRRLAQFLGMSIDLLAAIPSVVFGLWGAGQLIGTLFPVNAWLSDHLGFLPLFGGPAANPPRVILSVGIVLAVMVLPIITAISREVFALTPAANKEAALALGATKWEMIRLAVLPFGRSGIVGAAMLGLGRALGETMAVLMILSPGLTYSLNLIQAGKQQTIAANIAAQFPEANPLGVSTLILTGLVLFVITFAVNFLARRIVARGTRGRTVA